MTKYFEGKEEMAENLMEKIKKNRLEELITNPLNTALLCAVFEDHGEPSLHSKRIVRQGYPVYFEALLLQTKTRATRKTYHRL